MLVNSICNFRATELALIGVDKYSKILYFQICLCSRKSLKFNFATLLTQHDETTSLPSLIVNDHSPYMY